MNNDFTLGSLSQKKYTRTDHFNEKTNEYTHKVAQQQGLSTKTARKLVRKTIADGVGYNQGQLGASEVAGMLSRKERRALAKAEKKKFKPVYAGGEPTYISPVERD